MRKNQPKAATCIIGCIIVLLASHPVKAAIGLQLMPLSGSLVLISNAYEHSADGSFLSRTLEFEERLRVVQRGFFSDPRLVDFSVELIPTFRQIETTYESSEQKDKTRDLNYRFDLGVLQGAEAPYGARFAAGRSTTVADVAFGGRYDTDSSDDSVNLEWRNLYLPMELTYSRRGFKQTFLQQGGQRQINRDEQWDSLRLSAQNSKMNLSLIGEDVQNNERAGFDYRRLLANVNHAVEWGRNSSLVSAFRYQDRTGFASQNYLQWTELARIQHTDNLRSQSTYRYYSSGTSNKSTTHQAGFSLQHELYNNLTSRVRVEGRRTDSARFQQQDHVVGGSGQYRKKFFGLNFSLGVSGEYRAVDRNSEAGLLEVVNEEHQAGFTVPIILENRFVDANTVRVASARDGFIYDESIDYDLLPIGEALLEVRIIPGGRIVPGELLWISYSFEVSPSAEYTRALTGYFFSVANSWFSLSHDATQTDPKLTSGNESALPPAETYSNTALDLNWRTGPLRYRLGARSYFRRLGGFETETLTYTGTIDFRVSQRFDVFLSGNQSTTENLGTVGDLGVTDPNLERKDYKSDYTTVDLGFSWRPLANLSIGQRFGVWRRTEESQSDPLGNRDQRFRFAELEVSYYVRSITVDFRYYHNKNEIDERNWVDDRLMLRVSRAF